MIETLEERKSRLKAEINIAKDLLFTNLNNTKPSNYLPSSSSLFSSIKQNPGTAISTILSIGSMFIQKSNKMNRLINIYNVVSPFLKQKR